MQHPLVFSLDFSDTLSIVWIFNASLRSEATIRFSTTLARLSLLTIIAAAGTRVTVHAQTLLVLGAEDDAAPLAYADGSGFVADVVKQAFARVGWQVQLKVMPYARCKALAIDGQLAGCYSACKTPELQSKLLFPRRALYESRNLLIASTASALTGCDPSQWPKPIRVGTVRGYEYTPSMMAILHANRVIAEEADSEVNNLRKLQAGRLDAVVVTVDQVKRTELLQALAHTSQPLKTVCDLGTQPAYVAFSRKHPLGASARKLFDQGMANLIQDGTLSQLQEDWRHRSLERARAKKH